MVLVSKEDHCLVDLLHRWRNGDLDCEIPLVVSNHPDLRSLVEWHGIEFRHVDFGAGRKAEAFAEVATLFDGVRGDVMVLARFMQIIPPDLCERYFGRIINIHHSFLPSFAGARPYHQAFERGVKLIGATCHYVTAELDAGPIIEQDTARIDHADTVEELLRIGREVERSVLARGLRWHLADRVLLNGHRDRGLRVVPHPSGRAAGGIGWQHGVVSPGPPTPIDHTRAICLALPSVTERLSHGTPTFFVRGPDGVRLRLGGRPPRQRLPPISGAPPDPGSRRC